MPQAGFEPTISVTKRPPRRANVAIGLEKADNPYSTIWHADWHSASDIHEPSWNIHYLRKIWSFHGDWIQWIRLGVLAVCEWQQMQSVSKTMDQKQLSIGWSPD
jgi:hypothetical protein